MLLIQIVAATLLILGSALIFRALLAIDLADQPRSTSRPRLVARLRREASQTDDRQRCPARPDARGSLAAAARDWPREGSRATMAASVLHDPVVQRPSTPPFQGGDRGFESHQGRQIRPFQALRWIYFTAGSGEGPLRVQLGPLRASLL